MSVLAPVLVTRPMADASIWVEQLRAQGLPAEALPLLQIVAVMTPDDLRSCWRRLPQFAALMFVSGNAVEHFFSGWTGPWPENVRCLAPGPGTGSRLRASGVPTQLIDEPALDAPQFDSEALWQVISHRPWMGRRVLLVRGRSEQAGAAPGRDWLAQQLQSQGAVVEAVCVYERRAVPMTEPLRQRMARACVDGSLWLFSSSEAVGHLPSDLQWGRARALATHPRIAQAARAIGFAQVLESRPALPEVIASIKSAFHE